MQTHTQVHLMCIVSVSVGLSNLSVHIYIIWYLEVHWATWNVFCEYRKWTSAHFPVAHSCEGWGSVWNVGFTPWSHLLMNHHIFNSNSLLGIINRKLVSKSKNWVRKGDYENVQWQKPDPPNPIYAAEFPNALECLVTHWLLPRAGLV